jgi:hypothetical protein
VYVNGCDIGFKLVGNQFCSFENLSGSSCNVGLHLTQSAAGGGGNNNNFYDCWFSYNHVGICANQASVYPFHNNVFTNLVTHTNDVCAVYLKGAKIFDITNWAPEANGAGASTYSYDGETIKNGIIHIDAGRVVLHDYNNVSNTNPMTVENKGAITIDGGGGGAIRPAVDSTSQFGFTDAPFAYYKGMTNTVLTNAPMFVANGIMAYMVTIPTIRKAEWLTNDALILKGSYSVEHGYYSAGTSCSYAYVADATMGDVMQFTSAGGDQAVIVTASSSYTTVGTTVVLSFLVKSSSSSAIWDWNLAQSTANGSLQIPANEWYRVVLFGKLTEPTRGAHIVLTPQASAAGETLRVCRIHSGQNMSEKVMARFFREGLYNPGRPDVTGSAGGNAALASLLTQLEALGLITDSST